MFLSIDHGKRKKALIWDYGYRLIRLHYKDRQNHEAARNISYSHDRMSIVSVEFNIANTYPAWSVVWTSCFLNGRASIFYKQEGMNTET